MRVTSTPTARATLYLAGAALLVTGCASQKTSSGSTLPKLLIATTAAGAAPAAAAAIAPGTAGGPETRMGIFAGYVIAGTLPDQPTHAPIYLWPSTKPSQSDVVKLASALGMSGTPTRHTYGWELKTAAGDLRVRDDQGQRWSYNRADTEPCPAFQTDIDNPDSVSTGFGCAVAVAAPPVAASPAVGAPAAGAPTVAPPTFSPPANGPDEATTKAAAASLLTALGVTGDEQYSSGAPTSYLTVSPKVAGLPTQGIETNVNVDARGITGATGQLQAPTAGDDYPLQTAKAAFDSLAARPQPMIAMYCGPIPGGGPNRFGGVAPSAGGAKGAPAPSAVGAPTPIAPPAPVNSGSADSPPADATQPVEVPPVPCPTPEPIKITGAHLGLEIEYNATTAGATILVPSWFFTLADGSVATTAIAVDPSYLGTPPQPSDVAIGGSSAGSSGGGGASGFSAVPPMPPPAASAVAPKPASS